MYSCSNGYQLSGVMTRTCEDGPSGGEWTGSIPSCKGMKTNSEITFISYNYVAICPALPAFTNGMISYSTSGTAILEGDVATHTCHEGYRPSSEVSRSCQSDKTWSDEAITCQGNESVHETTYQHSLSLYKYNKCSWSVSVHNYRVYTT